MNARRGIFRVARVRRLGFRRPSFTLVEMLVVVTIIAILAGIVYGGMEAVRLNAQINRTRATIAKLHLLIMGKYDSFRTRRVPIDLDSRAPLTSSRQVGRVKLWAIRELMRMEMPERYVDMNANGQPAMFRWPAGGDQFQVPPSALFMTYAEYRKTLEKQGKIPSPRYGSAEMLYMVVTLGCPNGRQSFSEDEIGDLDDDGWPEFLDAWGNPIFFLRWAPGFTDSAIQLTPGAPMPSQPTGVVTVAYAAEKQHDPFDPMRVEPDAYQLIPLIYSAGPDGIYDIETNDEQYSYFKDQMHSPFGSGTLKIGTPVDRDNYSRTGNTPANGRLDHYDNIHNHRMGTR